MALQSDVWRFLEKERERGSAWCLTLLTAGHIISCGKSFGLFCVPSISILRQVKASESTKPMHGA